MPAPSRGRERARRRRSRRCPYRACRAGSNRRRRRARRRLEYEVGAVGEQHRIDLRDVADGACRLPRVVEARKQGGSGLLHQGVDTLSRRRASRRGVPARPPRATCADASGPVDRALSSCAESYLLRDATSASGHGFDESGAGVTRRGFRACSRRQPHDRRSSSATSTAVRTFSSELLRDAGARRRGRTVDAARMRGCGSSVTSSIVALTASARSSSCSVSQQEGDVHCLLGNHELLLVAARRFPDVAAGEPGLTFRRIWEMNGGVAARSRAVDGRPHRVASVTPGRGARGGDADRSRRLGHVSALRTARSTP